MLKPELYKKTVDILYDAYFKDTLEHGNYCGCAVGNIIAANNSEIRVSVVPSEWRDKVRWNGGLSLGYFWFDIIGGIDLLNSSNSHIGRQHIASTGYSVLEISRIERGFETAYRGENEEEWMFNGLCDVLEVLKDIHEVTDEDAEVNTTRFRTHYKAKALVIDHGF